MKFADLKLG